MKGSSGISKTQIDAEVYYLLVVAYRVGKTVVRCATQDDNGDYVFGLSFKPSDLVVPMISNGEAYSPKLYT